MARKPKEINIEAEHAEHVARLHALIGQPIPLSARYVRGARPTLVAIHGDRAIIRYPNGATLTHVPLRDLVDDAAYWRG